MGGYAEQGPNTEILFLILSIYVGESIHFFLLNFILIYRELC